jgi:serine/threonine-protein kinase RsbT
MRLEVCEQIHVEQARRIARQAARAAGFDEPRCEAVVLAVSELAANLVRHARGGALRITAIEAQGVPGVEVESTDEGPGIADLEGALDDGFSTAGGLGSGLPAVRRLMDEFEVIETGPQGTRIRARAWSTR